MTEQASPDIVGWVVKVTAQPLGCEPPREEYYLVALADKFVAEDVVRDAVQATADPFVEAVRAVPANEITGQRMKPGEVNVPKRLTPAIPTGLPSTSSISPRDEQEHEPDRGKDLAAVSLRRHGGRRAVRRVRQTCPQRGAPR